MFKKELKDIATYEAGKPIELVMREFGIDKKNIIKLGSNENPYGTSLKVIESIKNHSCNASFYPDDSFYALKQSLAAKYNLDSQNIIIGSGSDQIIEFCLQGVEHNNACVIMAKTTFAMYEVYSKLAGVEICKTNGKIHNLDEFLEVYKSVYAKNKRVSIIFLCVPNNPLGECLDSNEIIKFIESINAIDSDTLILLDGAYQEFAAFKDSKKAIIPNEYIKKFANVIYLGTFSKVYGLGGMRVGYGLADKNIIANLHKVRPPFNITTLSLEAAIVALQDSEFVQKSVESNFSQMRRYEDFAKSNNITFIDSYTNFITYFCDRFSASDLCAWLLQRGVIVRDLKSYGLNALRITIGTEIQNDKVLSYLQKYLAK